jgi:branched-chain amino acid transport system permease protein
MGIDAGRTAATVSFLSGALAGAGGVLIGLNTNAIQPYMGEQMLLRGFVVIIVGGLGDIRGALIAGLMLGMVEVLTAGYLASELKDAVGFLILVFVLWTRPLGLFGRAVIRRA